jgi:hypothetical protein
VEAHPGQALVKEGFNHTPGRRLFDVDTRRFDFLTQKLYGRKIAAYSAPGSQMLHVFRRVEAGDFADVGELRRAG